MSDRNENNKKHNDMPHGDAPYDRDPPPVKTVLRRTFHSNIRYNSDGSRVISLGADKRVPNGDAATIHSEFTLVYNAEGELDSISHVVRHSDADDRGARTIREVYEWHAERPDRYRVTKHASSSGSGPNSIDDGEATSERWERFTDTFDPRAVAVAGELSLTETPRFLERYLPAEWTDLLQE